MPNAIHYKFNKENEKLSVAGSKDSQVNNDLEKSSTQAAPKFSVFTEKQFDRIEQIKHLPKDLLLEMRAIAKVLPFRVNQYVIDKLIDWDNVPHDPMFQLTFPQPGMLEQTDVNTMVDLIRSDADRKTIELVSHEIRNKLNPHPGGQQILNVPQEDGKTIPGIQHKYNETVLFFPSQGQTCHSYCTFCFRWAQFVGDKDLRFSSHEVNSLHQYLKNHHEVTDLLITGGDPMVMKTKHLEQYINPLTTAEFNHIQTIRIGTKALSFWPYRFVSDNDADDLLRLLEKTVKSGKHVAIMAHMNHWKELDNPVVHEAIRRIRDTGAVIRSQSPLLANINDDADTWANLWKTQTRLGIIPYYMFVERDTGARKYFEVPLVKACEIYRNAMKQVSGLSRTARGPSMSSAPGKIEIQGISEIAGEKVFVLRFIQGRNNDWVQKPFFAKFDEKATWLNDLKPAFGESEFFFEEEYRKICLEHNTNDNCIY